MSLDYSILRDQMLKMHLIPRGINDPNVLQAMKTVPRERFIPEQLREFAYNDNPLPISLGQTISQPYIVALMAQAAKLDKSARCLEIGTGSGYSAAVLAQISKEVFTVERLASLSESAQHICQILGYSNLQFSCSDGSLGWPEHAPYDAIVVTACAPKAPEVLLNQLAEGGRLIIPVGDLYSQELQRITKISDEKYKIEILDFVRFVPLIGKQGHPIN